MHTPSYTMTSWTVKFVLQRVLRCVSAHVRELSLLSDSRCARWRVKDPSVFAGVAGTAKKLMQGVTKALRAPDDCPSCRPARVV